MEKTICLYIQTYTNRGGFIGRLTFWTGDRTWPLWVKHLLWTIPPNAVWTYASCRARARARGTRVSRGKSQSLVDKMKKNMNSSMLASLATMPPAAGIEATLGNRVGGTPKSILRCTWSYPFLIHWFITELCCRWQVEHIKG